MNRNSHNLRGYSVNSPPHWRRIFIALALALVIGNAGQIAPAQAAPANVPVKLYMEIVSPKKRVCVGETVHYEARVYIPPFTSPKGTKVGAVPLPGIKVEAFSQNKSVGDFTNTKKGFSVSTTSGIGLDPSNYELAPLTGLFPFKAKKAGNTTLYFEGIAFGDYVSDKVEVQVKVINCKFKVIATSQMSWSGEGGSIEYRGVILDGLITADETGYIFTGTAPVVWLATAAVPNCSAVYSLGIGKVAMRGDLNDSGQLVLNLTYDPVEFHGQVTCPWGSGPKENLTLFPSTLKVTVSSSGGVVNPNQQIADPVPALGSALVSVIPVEDVK